VRSVLCFLFDIYIFAEELSVFFPLLLVMTDLNNYYFDLAETEGCLVSPTVGQPCVALFEEMWYRAEVLNISVNDMTVHYVDFGNEETLKPSGVKQITPLFLKTPKVAIECSLDLNRDEWSEDSTKFFEELTANDEQLIIKILRCQGGRYEVKVFNKDGSCYSAELLSTLQGAGISLTYFTDSRTILVKGSKA